MKRFDTLQKFRKLFAVLVAAVAVVVLITLLGLAHVLNQSRLRYYDAAAETARNLAITLKGSLQAHLLEMERARQPTGAGLEIDGSRLDEAFAALKIGDHGSIIVLDAGKRVLHRYPQVPGMPIGAVIKVNPRTQTILDGQAQRGTFVVISPRDGLERTLSIEKVGDYPVYVVVGLASKDFLAPWHDREIRNAGIFATILLLLAAALLLSVRIGVRKQLQSLQQLVEAEHALQQSLARLTTSEARWRSLTEGLPQMVWTATPELTVDFISHHWEAFTGLPPGALMDQLAWSRTVHPDDLPGLIAQWAHARKAGREFRYLGRLRRRDGAWRVFDHHALAQHDSDGKLVGWLGSSTDRTEAHEAHAALLQAKDEALKAGRAKSDFVANMSHEIRSPMNAVLGMLQLLQQTAMDERQRDYVNKAQAAGRALLALLNDILDFSKVEAGKLGLDPHPFRLDQLWRDLAVILEANVGAREIAVRFRIAPALPEALVGDDLRLQQILLNLAGNAVKFTERGEVVVAAQLAGREAGRLAVRFAISDTGIGISDEQRQRIFDGFSQAEASTARRYGGTGLGLAISQRLVTLMGGSLGVQSVLGKGSVFDFTLWFDAAPAALPAVAAPVPAVTPGVRLAGLRLLLVDDSPANLQVAGELLANEGAQMQVVHSGRAAIEVLAGGAPLPDLILMDIQMPDMDGYETTQAILRQLGPAAPPIVAMTANAMAADRAAALDAGMVDHIGKPFELNQLVAVIRHHAGRSAVQDAAPAMSATAATSAAAAIAGEPASAGADAVPSAIASDAALQRMGGLKSVYLMALRGFTSEAESLAARIVAGRDGGDAAAVLTPLHTLKGLAGTIGAERVQALARQAEASLKLLVAGAAAREGGAGARAVATEGLVANERAIAAGLAWQQLGQVLAALPALNAEVAALVARLEAR